nr:PREDICTED: uncharacterized protein LOC105672930 [Linepithema humile]
MTSILLATMSLVKLYTCYFNRSKMKTLADHLFADWNALETSKEHQIMKNYATKGRRYSLGYSLYCFIALCVFLSLSLTPQLLDILLPLNESRPIVLTYPGYYFVDEREYFFYMFSHAVVAWEIAIAAIVAHDCIFVTYVEHVCSMFAVVGLAQLLENAFTIPFAIQILIAVLGMSITLLQIAQQNDTSDILETMRYALYVIGELIHLFFLSSEGQKLIDHSLQMRDKIYCSSWYEVSMKSQKLLILVMMKSIQPSFLSAGKVYIFCLESFTTMRILIDQLFVNWNELETPEEYEIMKKYAETARRYSFRYSLYCFSSTYFFMCVSLMPQLLDVILPLNESRPILSTYPGYYFVDEKKYFFYIFLHAVIAWEIAMTGIVTHDCMLLTYIEHICSIFTIIGFTQLLEDTFSLSLAIQIMINTVMISITLLQITQQHADIIEMMRYILYVGGQLIHLFCLSFEGQKLIDHSLRIHDKIYNSIWYEVPVKSQKMLLFIMQKSLRPVFLSAGKIYIFSMENFAMIVQTSLSYFTVLSSLE